MVKCLLIEKNTRIFFRQKFIAGVIQECFDNGSSFFDEEKKKVFSIKCGDENKDFIFICKTHLSIVLFAKKQFACIDAPSLENTKLLTLMVRKRHFARLVLNIL